MTDLDYLSEPMPDYFDDGQYRRLHFWLSFDYRRPPLTANQRIHWRRKAEITAAVRTATMINARRIPNLTRCEVALTWYVTDRRRRDADNLVPTLKAMCDGLVDAGVVADDIPSLMVKHMPVIEFDAEVRPHMVLRVSSLPAEAVAA